MSVKSNRKRNREKSMFLMTDGTERLVTEHSAPHGAYMAAGCNEPDFRSKTISKLILNRKSF